MTRLPRTKAALAAAGGAAVLALSATGIASAACGTYSGRGCAPASARVDTQPPVFTTPTEITNSLFPISELESVVLLGRVDGKPFRSETTLLPGTLTVDWAGQRVRVLVSQYMAFLDGHLDEVAIDRYAQADDGSVWYLGEDVFDYRQGAAAITEGTWLAGRDGPAAMIMPGSPRLADVFRPENVIGVVFEEVEVTSVDGTVRGPLGPVDGALVAQELHLDGSHSEKTFAPGYGEFRTESDGDVEALALAVPTDALASSLPGDLRFLVTASWGVLENARLDDWEAARSTVRRMQKAWRRLQNGERQPAPIVRELTRALDALERAVDGRRPSRTAQLAIETARPALDLELRYRPRTEVDVERFHLWTQQLRVHAARGDLAATAGDVAVLEWMRERLGDAVPDATLDELDAGLQALRAAADARNLRAAGDHAARLGALARRTSAG